MWHVVMWPTVQSCDLLSCHVTAASGGARPRQSPADSHCHGDGDSQEEPVCTSVWGWQLCHHHRGHIHTQSACPHSASIRCRHGSKQTFQSFIFPMLHIIYSSQSLFILLRLLNFIPHYLSCTFTYKYKFVSLINHVKFFVIVLSKKCFNIIIIIMFSKSIDSMEIMSLQQLKNHWMTCFVFVLCLFHIILFHQTS